MQERRGALGARGEDLAASFMTGRGATIIARNYRTRYGELDIVAMEGSTLVFVEVKTRSSSRYASPEIAVFGEKRRRLRLLAEAFISARRPRFDSCRFDVISIVMDPVPRVTHIQDAF